VRCGIRTGLPEAVAAALIEFMTGTLVGNPRRVGTMLRRDLVGIWSARRGTYRVLYRINDDPKEVVVLRIEHRRDAYREPPAEPTTNQREIRPAGLPG
jgi:mRNA-degrading endonuclease RelE of RelBE toxin-antitoxin system